jgi:hypothetical protein
VPVHGFTVAHTPRPSAPARPPLRNLNRPPARSAACASTEKPIVVRRFFPSPQGSWCDVLRRLDDVALDYLFLDAGFLRVLPGSQPVKVSCVGNRPDIRCWHTILGDAYGLPVQSPAAAPENQKVSKTPNCLTNSIVSDRRTFVSFERSDIRHPHGR